MSDNNLDEIVIDELEDTSTEEETSNNTEEPAENSTDDKGKKAEELRKKQAGYYSRHPEELEMLVKEATALATKGKAPTKPNESDSVADELKELKKELALKDAAIEFDLSKEDLKFAKGNSPEEIYDWAKEFSSYKKELGYNSNEDNNSDSNSPSGQRYIKKTNTPSNVGKKQTLEELESELHNTKFTL